MKRMKKIGFLGLAAFAMILCLLWKPAWADDQEEDLSGIGSRDQVIDQGQVTDTVFWKVTENDQGQHTLLIDGTGPMTDYKSVNDVPWLKWKNTLYHMEIGDGITRIGNHSMNGFSISSVHIGSGVESIGKYAFQHGRNMKEIRIPGNVKRVETAAFEFHHGLAEIVLEEGIEVLEYHCFATQNGIIKDIFRGKAFLEFFLIVLQICG